MNILGLISQLIGIETLRLTKWMTLSLQQDMGILTQYNSSSHFPLKKLLTKASEALSPANPDCLIDPLSPPFCKCMWI